MSVLSVRQIVNCNLSSGKLAIDRTSKPIIADPRQRIRFGGVLYRQFNIDARLRDSHGFCQSGMFMEVLFENMAARRCTAPLQIALTWFDVKHMWSGDNYIGWNVDVNVDCCPQRCAWCRDGDVRKRVWLSYIQNSIHCVGNHAKEHP